MEIQQGIAFARAQDMSGQLLQVMIEGRLPEEGVYVGRTYMDAPGVDGNVFIEYTGQLISGDIVPVRIFDSRGYDLVGQVEWPE